MNECACGRMVLRWDGDGRSHVQRVEKPEYAREGAHSVTESRGVGADGAGGEKIMPDSTCHLECSI